MLKRRKVLTETISLELPGELNRSSVRALSAATGAKNEAHETALTTSVAFGGEAWLLDVILESGADLGHSCGGMGTCGTCQIVIVEGEALLEARNEIETEMAEIRGYKTCERLACQTRAVNGIKVRIP